MRQGWKEVKTWSWGHLGLLPARPPRTLSEHSSAWYFLGHEEAGVNIHLPLPTCDGRMLWGLDSTVSCLHPRVRESPRAGEGRAEQKQLDCGSSQPSQGGGLVPGHSWQGQHSRSAHLGQPGTLSPQQASPDPCLCRRHANTQRQVWLSLIDTHTFSLFIHLSEGI